MRYNRSVGCRAFHTISNETRCAPLQRSTLLASSRDHPLRQRGVESLGASCGLPPRGSGAGQQGVRNEKTADTKTATNIRIAII